MAEDFWEKKVGGLKSCRELKNVNFQRLKFDRFIVPDSYCTFKCIFCNRLAMYLSAVLFIQEFKSQSALCRLSDAEFHSFMSFLQGFHKRYAFEEIFFFVNLVL